MGPIPLGEPQRDVPFRLELHVVRLAGRPVTVRAEPAGRARVAGAARAGARAAGSGRAVALGELQERFDFDTKVRVAAADFVEPGGALVGRAVESGIEELIDTSESLRCDHGRESLVASETEAQHARPSCIGRVSAAVIESSPSGPALEGAMEGARF